MRIVGGVIAVVGLMALIACQLDVTPTPNIESTVQARVLATTTAQPTATPSQTATPVVSPSPTLTPSPPQTATATAASDLSGTSANLETPEPTPTATASLTVSVSSNRLAQLEADLRRSAEEWASLITNNDWVGAVQKFAPDLIAACDMGDLRDLQYRFLAGDDGPDLTVKVRKIEVLGLSGQVYITLVTGRFVNEVKDPYVWMLDDSQWQLSFPDPDRRCVRYAPESIPTSLGITRQEFLSQFTAEVRRIHEKLSCRQSPDGLAQLSLASQDYELLERGFYVDERLTDPLVEQRLPRMQRVFTYELPFPPSPYLEPRASTRMILWGEEWALTKVVLQGYRDELEEDHCVDIRQLTYFRAIAELLAPAWPRTFDYIGWFKGNRPTEVTRPIYTRFDGTEIPEPPPDGEHIAAYYYAGCDPEYAALCGPRSLTWVLRFSSGVGR